MAITIEVIEALLQQFKEMMSEISADLRQAHDRIASLETSRAVNEELTLARRLQLDAIEKHVSMLEAQVSELRTQRDKGWGMLAGFAASSAAGGGIVTALIKLLS